MNLINYKKGFVFFLILICSTLAQNNVIPFYEQTTIHSEILNEDRDIMIYTPRGYNSTDAGYPVLYLTDGNRHIRHTIGIIEFLNTQGFAPPMIIVGIPNTVRSRDLTPPSEVNTNVAQRGGANRFVSFIRDELGNYISENYKTNGFDILFGHSFGGLFSVNAIANHSEKFDAFISVSPSLQWNNFDFSKNIISYLSDINENKWLYLAVGGLDPERIKEGCKTFDDNMKKLDNDKISWNYGYFEEETHGSVVHLAIYEGISKIFDSWRITREEASQSIEKLEQHFKNLSQKFGFKVLPGEALVNGLGYGKIRTNEYDDAVKLFLMNAKNYPNSANNFDSLGDGYRAMGKMKEAKEAYAKAVEIGREVNDPNLRVYINNLNSVD